MYRYNNNNSIVRAGFVLNLLSKFTIDEIESSLVKLFMEENQLSTKNDFLNGIIEGTNDKIKNEIKNYFDVKDIDIILKTLERVFELLIEEKDRKINGAFYTPKFIVNYIVGKTINRDTTVCDCACGSGAFLIEATKKLHKITKKPMIDIIEKNIFGVDIIERSVKRAKILLTLLALQNGEDKKDIDFNLKVADSLSLNWKKEFPDVFQDDGFGAVVSNPPYVRTKNLPEQLRKRIQSRWMTASNGNIDLFIPFIELGVNLLNKNGCLGYIIPNSFFTSLTSKKLREFLQENKYIKETIDFNHIQIFTDATTYTCITILDKKEKDIFKYALIEDETQLKNLHNIKPFDIKFSNLNPESWNLLSKIDSENIYKIETVGIPLSDLARISTGIATLRNYLFVIKNAEEHNGYYEKEFDGKIFKIEKGITKEIIKASVIKSEEDIKNNKRRVIFPYKKTGKRFQVISESELRSKYPECYKYLCVIKDELKKRDKGKKKYDVWYSYGRSQGLENGISPKILTPDISSKPRFVICRKKDILFYVGYAIWLNRFQTTLKPRKSDIDIEALNKILNSKIFEYYIKKTSRHYSSGYRSFAKHFIEKFSIPELSKEEIRFLKKTDDKKEIDEFLEKKYAINL